MTAWARWKDREQRLELVPFQQAPRPPMTDALAQACARAVHVVTPGGEIMRAGRASLLVAEQLGYRVFAKVMRVPPLVWLVELGYRVVAGNRRFFARFMFKKETYP